MQWEPYNLTYQAK